LVRQPLLSVIAKPKIFADFLAHQFDKIDVRAQTGIPAACSFALVIHIGRLAFSWAVSRQLCDSWYG
jgi:hypothetical protein